LGEVKDMLSALTTHLKRPLLLDRLAAGWADAAAANPYLALQVSSLALFPADTSASPSSISPLFLPLRDFLWKKNERWISSSIGNRKRKGK